GATSLRKNAKLSSTTPGSMVTRWTARALPGPGGVAPISTSVSSKFSTVMSPPRGSHDLSNPGFCASEPGQTAPADNIGEVFDPGRPPHGGGPHGERPHGG